MRWLKLRNLSASSSAVWIRGKSYRRKAACTFEKVPATGGQEIIPVQKVPILHVPGSLLVAYSLVHENRSMSCRSSFAQAPLDLGNFNLELDARLLQTIARSGLLVPGQIVMTDLAFTWYRDLQLTVTEVIDHGLHCIAEHNTQLCFKELLPSCLAGRDTVPFSKTPDVVQLSLGYHLSLIHI